MYEIDENGELVFKRKVVMTMTEERAALLDKILLAVAESNQTVILHATSPNDKTEYISAGRDLEKLELGNCYHLKMESFLFYLKESLL